MSFRNRKENLFVVLVVSMLVIGAVLIIYDQFTLFLSEGGVLFNRATFISIIGLILCLAGLIMLRKLN